MRDFYLPDLNTLILDYFGLFFLLYIEIRIAAGVTSQHGMLTSPRHLILPLVCPEVRVRSFISLMCNSYLSFESDHWYLIHYLLYAYLYPSTNLTPFHGTLFVGFFYCTVGIITVTAFQISIFFIFF
jgi:hypothetical protein